MIYIALFLILVLIIVCFYFHFSNQKKLSLISDFISELFSTLEIDKMLPIVLDKIVSMLKPTRCSIMMLDNHNCLRIRVGKNISKYAMRAMKLKYGEGLAGKSLSTGLITFIKDISKSQEYYKLFEVGYKKVKKESMVIIPLKYQETKYGVINLHYPVRKKFPSNSTEKIVLKLIQDQVSVAIHNCYTYQEVVSDSMTKLYNHHYFVKRLEEEVYLSRKYSTKLSLIMFDIDHFKKINDTYGHQVGDLVLIEVANLLKEFVRATDICGRYGGEEFGIIMPNTNLKGAKIIAERLREDIANHKIFVLDKSISVTCSFGVAENNFDESVEDFLYRADKMLYTAKNMGRNKVCG